MERTPITVIKDGYRWYSLRVEGAREQRASLALHFYGAAGYIPDYDLVKKLWVPRMSVKVKAKVKQVSILPGYLFMEAILSRKLYSFLRRCDIPYIYGWVRHRGSWPSDIPIEEMERLVLLEEEDPTLKAPVRVFNVGEKVSFPSLNIEGIVAGMSDAFLVLNVNVFHRNVICRIRKDQLGEVVKLEEDDVYL